MNDFKKSWEITKNWQLIHPFLGIVAALLCGYLIARRVQSALPTLPKTGATLLLIVLTIVLAYIFIKISLWCFKKLKNRWHVNFRWEFIAIFLCFAVTGSSAGRVSDPIMSLLQLSKDTTNGWIYWPVRLLMIFPIYQVLLVMFGWVFGQYSFFKKFAAKMISRMGFGFLLKK